MTRLHLGFTGTRHGMTPAQRLAVSRLIAEIVGGAAFTAHHGDCVGADSEFHDLCHGYADVTVACPTSPSPGMRVVIHPGPLDDVAHQAGRAGDERREALPHMRRNRDIVRAATVMIAAPYEDTEQSRGGTWRTIGMARQAGRPLAIVRRDGEVTRERWDVAQPARTAP